MLLSGKTALVYGASGAVGGAVARAFAREGASVILSARRREPLEIVSREIAERGGVAGVMTVDALDPIAEGVETAAHGAKLLELGCELAQGYGVARPMPADAFQPWVAAWRTRAQWTA